MARPRFTGQGFTNPLDSLGFNAESRHRAKPPISNAFMSNEAFHAENVSGNQEFHGFGGAVGGEVVEKGVKKGFLKRIGGAFTGRFGRKGARKGAIKKGGKEVLEEGGEDAVQATLKAQQKALVASAKGPVRKFAIGTAGAVVVALYGINVLGGPVVEELTGANCPEKAIDAGYEEGTEEYTQFIEECQEKAAERLALGGGIGLGVLALIGIVLLRPKKSE